jgi:D-glutamate cyclase-like, C-terminal
MSIENIVLSRDHRGISALRPYLAPDFCERAATLILEHPGTVLIATGFYVPAGCATETDGPPGAIALGRVVASLGSRVIYLTDAYTAPLLRGLLADGGEVLEFPMADHQTSWHHAADLLASLAPSLTISVERCGLTDEGVYRNMRGVDVSGYHAKIDYLFREHRCSVGIGDGGNEIGMGNLAAAIPIVMPIVGRPCATTTTRLVIASVSNWGAWGVIAAISRLRRVNLLPSVGEAHDLLVEAVALGAVDGTTGKRTASVDGFPMEENDRVLAEMHGWLGRYGIG